MEKYNQKEIESKWQDTWEKNKQFESQMDFSMPKKYIVPMFPYPSGNIHMGHMRNYTISDVISRYWRNKGYNVCHPIGWDSFGMPAETAAITNNIHPMDWTRKNINKMREQMKSMGISFDWSKEISTCEKDYWKWEQKFFIDMWKTGFIERKSGIVNWDPVDESVIANEQVINGRGWRSGAIIEQKEMVQYYFKTTMFAEEMYNDIEKIKEKWPEIITKQQREWIGKSEGHEVEFSDSVVCFTTKADTIMDVKFIAVPMDSGEERIIGNVKHPITGDIIPIYTCNYVIDGYGTGYVMGVPNDDKRDRDFARRHNIEFSEEKNIIDITNFDFIKKKTNYKIKDWCVSRQRYWGTPIPMIHCPKCGVIPNENTVEAPIDVVFNGKGNPIKNHPTWKNISCPKCGSDAEKETDTMDTFVQSSWYFIRYISNFDGEKFDSESIKYWFPVDYYIGGPEHAVSHMIYSRFFWRVFKKMGYIDSDIVDPFDTVICQGMVKNGGKKMSKSSGNGVSPDEIIEKWGADVSRMYIMFAGPSDQDIEWSDKNIIGSFRFINKFWNGQYSIDKIEYKPTEFDRFAREQIVMMPDRIQRVYEKNYNFNTIVAFAMTVYNAISKTSDPDIWRDGYKAIIDAISPICPHVCDEIKSNIFGSSK